MKKIKLTKNKYAIIDRDDYNLVNTFRWHFSNGYALKNKTKDNKYRLMHRLILDANPNETIDHINGNGLDNRRRNLRICSQGQNTKNSSKHKDGTSMYKGVHFHKPSGRWRAQICVNYQRISLGCFKSQMDAAIAYDLAALRYHGAYCRLNILGK